MFPTRKSSPHRSRSFDMMPSGEGAETIEGCSEPSPVVSSAAESDEDAMAELRYRLSKRLTLAIPPRQKTMQDFEVSPLSSPQGYALDANGKLQGAYFSYQGHSHGRSNSMRSPTSTNSYLMGSPLIGAHSWRSNDAGSASSASTGGSVVEPLPPLQQEKQLLYHPTVHTPRTETFRALENPPILTAASTPSSVRTASTMEVAETVLLAVDEGPQCRDALEWCLNRGLLKNMRTLVVLHVMMPLQFIARGMANPSMALAWSEHLTDKVMLSSNKEHMHRVEARWQKARELVSSYKAFFADRPEVDVQCEIQERMGPPTRYIGEAVTKFGAELLIMGRYPTSTLYRSLSGGCVSDSVAAMLPKNVHYVFVRKRIRGGYLLTTRKQTDFWILN